MRKVHICSGVPASGKSTYIESHAEWCDVVIHRDIFRTSLREFMNAEEYFPVPAPKEWQLWIGACNSALVLNPRAAIWIDQTTNGIGALKKLLTALELRDLDDIIVLHIFDTPFDVCVERNKSREGNARVPDSAMDSMWAGFCRSPLTRQTIRSAGIGFAKKDIIIRHAFDGDKEE